MKHIDEAFHFKNEILIDLHIIFSLLTGLNKSDDFTFSFNKETFVIIFFLLGLLQKNIWNHPYI